MTQNTEVNESVCDVRFPSYYYLLSSMKFVINILLETYVRDPRDKAKDSITTKHFSLILACSRIKLLQGRGGGGRGGGGEVWSRRENLQSVTPFLFFVFATLFPSFNVAAYVFDFARARVCMCALARASV